MAELGDKWYDKDYYGERTRPWTNTGENTPHALLVDKNTWGYYSNEGEFIPGRKGQPLNDTIGLWLLNRDCSWATNTTLYIKAQSTLLRNDYSTVNENDVPFAMQATGHDSNLGSEFDEFSRNPIDRLAYNNSMSVNTIYSALYADINYAAYCMQAGILCFDWNETSKLQVRNLDNLASFINAQPDERDVVGLRGYLYRGTGNIRKGYNTPDTEAGADYMPPYHSGATAYRSVPIGDILTDRVIPEDASYLRSLIQDSHSKWIDDKVYSPFEQQSARWWYEPEGTNNSKFEINNQFAVGCYRDLPVSHIINGHYNIDANHKITGMFYKCNFSVQVFDDVSYRWRTKIVDQSTGEVIENGTDLTQIMGGHYLRVLTYIDIVDMKDATTKGEALRRAVLHEWAYLGFYFTSTDVYAQTLKTGTDAPAADLAKLYLPVFEGGVTTGRYVTGEAIREAPNADSSSVGGDEFAPTPNFDDMTPPLSNISILNFYATGRIYLDINSIETLVDNLRSLPAEIEESGSTLTPSDCWFFGADPYDFILGYFMFPAMFLDEFTLDALGFFDSYIRLGRFSTEYWEDSQASTPAKGKLTFLRVPQRREFIEPVLIPRRFNNFLDYEPYTTMSLYLPYYGSLQLPPSVFVGHRLSVYTLADMFTGFVTFLIYVDNKEYTTVSGKCRVELPFTGQDLSAYAETVINGKRQIVDNRWECAQNILNTTTYTIARSAASFGHGNIVGGIANIVGGVLSGGVSALATHSQNKFIDSKLERTQPSPQVITLGSGTEGLGNIVQPYVAFNYPEKFDYFDRDMAANYGKINGFACYDINTLSHYHGFTIMENPILDGLDCSAEEKDMIRSLLAEGVILP